MTIDRSTVSGTDEYRRRLAIGQPVIRTSPTPIVNAAGPIPTDLAAVQREIRHIADVSPRSRSRAANDRLTRLVAEAHRLGQIRDRSAARTAKRTASATPPIHRTTPKATAPKPATFTTRAPAAPFDPLRATPWQMRDAALAILERESRHLSPFQQDHVDRLLRESTDSRSALTVARWVYMTESPAYRSAFRKVLTGGSVAFTPAEVFAVSRLREEFFEELRALSESGSGGLAIPALVDPTIVPSAGELAPIVALSNVQVVTSNLYKPVSSDGATWAFQAEAAAVADETPTLAQRPVTVYMARSFVPASIELTMDYPDFFGEMSRLLSRGWLDLLASKTVVGSGSAEPFGVFTTMANTTAGTGAAHVTVTTAGSISATDVRAAWAALPERFRATSTWFAHENVVSKIRNIDGAAAQLDVVVDRQGTMLMGRPVVTSSYAPDFTGTTGTENFLVVGDFSGYTIASRMGATVELIPQMRDTSGKPLGERGLLAVARVGADVTVPGALRLLANS